MSTIEYEIEMTAACNRLRDAIRNKQAEEELAAKWRAMGETSSIQRRIKNEVNVFQTNVSFNKR